ncbi:ABC transporter permease [Sediminivirga luteola]|uniref:ABC transporter permease n=1 Tax=Sediminivirga luteola TaxID=1774748 RepID=UPI0016660124|nr:ABC transporter permease [Sediminivirga luteola]
MAGGLAPALTARAGLRVLGAVFVLWAAATITFFAVRAVPGDPAETIIGGPGSQAGEEALAAARAEYGLDLPLWEQYLRYLGGLLSGDLGTSYALRAPVTEVIGEQLPGTLALALTALLLGWALALLLVRQAARGGRVSRVLGTIMEVTAAALPHFWLGAVLILVFATTLGWLPSVSTPDLPGLILPALTLAIPLAGFLGQVMRESADDALASTFALSARARGESPAGLFWRHVLRHAVLPAASLSGWAFGTLISGAVIVETLFARPGLGRTLFLAVQGRDVPVVTGTVLVVALAYVLITFAGDLLEMLVDPRRRRV